MDMDVDPDVNVNVNVNGYATAYAHLAQLRITITPTLEHVYAALNIVSIVLVSILLGTIVISKRIKRDPTLLNAFVVIILVDLVNILYYLARAGHPLSVTAGASAGAGGPIPKEGVCRVQACILAGSQAAQAAAVFSMCLQLWINLMQLEKDVFYRFNNRYTMAGLLALPYLCIIAFVPPMVMATADTPELLTPSPFYCGLDDGALRSVYSKVALVFSILCLLVELHLIYLVLRRYRQTSKLTSATVTATNPDRQISISFILRVTVFMLWTMCMIMATLYQAFDETTESPFSDMIFACIGLLAFICFASQPDILRVWGSKRLARLWTMTRTRTRTGNGTGTGRKTQEDGWSDFLGRDESDTSLGVQPGIDVDVDVEQEEGYVERKTPPPGTGMEEDQDRDQVSLDLFSVLERGPSWDRDRHRHR